MPVLSRGGFHVQGNNFLVGYTTRVTGERLRELFLPEELRLKRDQKAAAEEAKKRFKRPFYKAQLRFYGIEIPVDMSRLDPDDLEALLRGLLKKAVVDGKVKSYRLIHVVASPSTNRHVHEPNADRIRRPHYRADANILLISVIRSRPRSWSSKRP